MKNTQAGEALVTRDEAIKADRETMKEILRRAAIFGEQARVPGPVPLLVLPEHPGGDGCLSCGTPLNGRRYRCELCARAAVLALEGPRC